MTGDRAIQRLYVLFGILIAGLIAMFVFTSVSADVLRTISWIGTLAILAYGGLMALQIERSKE